MCKERVVSSIEAGRLQFMLILVPIDASAPARAAVRVATALAMAQNIGLVMLHVHTGPQPASLDILAQLHEIAEPARNEGVAVRLRVVRGAVLHEICAWSQRPEVRMVVTGTRGPNPSSLPVLESTARALMKCSSVPVVAVRPGADGLGAKDGPIQVVSGGTTLPLAIGHQLSRCWNREMVLAPAPTNLAQVDSNLVDCSNALTVVPFDPDGDWVGWCVELMRRAKGGLALVGGRAATRRE